MLNRMALSIVTALSVTIGLAGASHAISSKTAATVKDVKSLPEQDQVKLALRAAPPHIAKDASVMTYGTDGKLTENKQGTNGFTCVPTVMNLPEPDPMCMDAAAHQWLTDLMNNAPKPTNTAPDGKLTENKQGTNGFTCVRLS